LGRGTVRDQVESANTAPLKAEKKSSVTVTSTVVMTAMVANYCGSCRGPGRPQAIHTPTAISAMTIRTMASMLLSNVTAAS
jgi:hypothetical protein